MVGSRETIVMVMIIGMPGIVLVLSIVVSSRETNVMTIIPDMYGIV